MASALPPVAVVIPLHNGGEWIRDTLSSVRAQTHPPAEIVVVDDRSTDDGPAQAAAIPGVRVLSLLHSPVDGAGPGRHYGFKATKAPLVTFLDQDDLWHPDHLRLLTKALRAHPHAPAALGHPRRFTNTQPPHYDAPRLDLRTYDPWSHFPITPIIWSPSGVLLRRSALASIGGWPTSWPVTDLWTWFRVSVDQPLVENRCVTYAKRDHARSKSAALRSEAGLPYVHELAQILAPLILRRTQRHPEMADTLTTRLHALSATGLLAAAHSTGTPALLLQAASSLEILAATEPQMLDRLLYHLFNYLLRPAYRGPIARQADLLELFVMNWPPSAPQTGAHLQSILVRGLSVRAFPTFVWRAPLQAPRWRLGTRATRHWLNTRWARLGG